MARRDAVIDALRGRGPADPDARQAWNDRDLRLTARVLLDHADAQAPGRSKGGKERTKQAREAREARIALIREWFPPQRDRRACKSLRRQVEARLVAAGKVPPQNASSQINEIEEALVTQLS